ncbi:MAG: hypothetical protein ABEJ31_15010 [Haloarculaceae archaeon]
MGNLTARGRHQDTEEVDPIIFTGAQQTRGYWQGILFNNSDQLPNELSHCIIEYAGNPTFSFENEPGNLVAKNGSRLAVNHTTIRESAGYGFVADWSGGATITSFDSNEITANRKGAVFTTARVADGLEDSTAYTGNDVDVIDIKKEHVQDGESTTWSVTDVPYRVRSSVTIRVRGEMAVEPGLTVAFGQNAGILVAMDQRAGTFTAVGKPNEEITFTGDQQTPGYWKGIKFEKTRSAGNKLEHCLVEYGGKEYSFAPAGGNVVVTSGGHATVADATLAESSNYGLVTDGESSASTSNVTYRSNAKGNTN